ncbi:MAG: Mov34/MPN/PAD-1 family protein [Myxococcales bacterium]|nr:Mov34/MPN/PAD-1 family protein [Myxococcales bacterium]
MVTSTTPWVEGGIRITRAALAAVEADAKARYGTSEEACGYLAGPADDGLLCDEAVALPNLANKLHALDPETYFRTGREFFAFNEKKFDDAVGRGRDGGRPVKVLYHSHLDCGAYFSPTDAAVLSFGEPPSAEGGEAKLGPGPAWPLCFLVTSVRRADAGPVVDDHKLFVWRERAFVEAPFEIVEEP